MIMIQQVTHPYLRVHSTYSMPEFTPLVKSTDLGSPPHNLIVMFNQALNSIQVSAKRDTLLCLFDYIEIVFYAEELNTYVGSPGR